jgi:hypothetical protein
MKKIFYFASHAYIAAIALGGLACLYGIYEKYHALASLQAFNMQKMNAIYNVFPFF